MTDEELQVLVVERRQELAERWFEEHKKTVPVQTDIDVIKGIHRRSLALLTALGRALSSVEPDDWGSFSHREVVQITALIARSLAEGGATAGAAGGLIPALGRALEGLGAPPFMSVLGPLSQVAVEAFTAARLSEMARQSMARLVRTTPILKLRSGTVLVAACGSPDRESAQAIVERTLRAVLSLKTKSPTVVLDLSSLEGEDATVLYAFMSLPAEVAALGGNCGVIGLTPARREALEHAGQNLDSVSSWDTLEQGLTELLPGGLLSRLGRALR